MSTQPQEHPAWCSPRWCTIGQTGGAHRSEPVVFTAPAVEIELGLHQGGEGGVFVTASLYNPLGRSELTTDGFHFTLAIEDAWRLAARFAGLLEQAR